MMRSCRCSRRWWRATEPTIGRLLGIPRIRSALRRRAERAWQSTDAPLFVCFGNINRNDGSKFLQLQLTVEDEGVFTTPWTATITYGRGAGDWLETVCAENIHEYYYNKNSEVPAAAKPDF